MDRNKMKKFLTGIFLASLIAGFSLMVTGCATKTGPENSVKPDAGASQQEQPVKPVRGG